MPNVNADWNATSGDAEILNKPTISTVGQTGWVGDIIGFPDYLGYFYNDQNFQTYADVNSNFVRISDNTGYLAAKFNVPTGTTSQYIRGDGSLAAFPSIPTIVADSQSSALRTLNSAFMISATRNAMVSYSVQITVTANIAGGQNGDVILEIAANSAFTNNVQTIAIAGNGQTYSLAAAIQGVQPTTNVLCGFIPAGYYARLRTVQNTGTPTFAYRAGQEIFM